MPAAKWAREVPGLNRGLRSQMFEKNEESIQIWDDYPTLVPTSWTVGADWVAGLLRGWVSKNEKGAGP